MNATAEVIEGRATIVSEEPPQERGLAVIPEQRAHLMSGLGAVALLSDEDFARNLELLTKGKARAQAIQKAILTDGVDYGREPGIDRPFLHKPGAEVMEKAYGFATSYTIERKVGNGDDVPALEYIVHAKVHLGDTDGPVIAEGVGSCNTHESKYRFRRGERECPECHKPTIIKGKLDGKLKGKWWCASFKDGCGKSFEPTDPRLVDQQVGNVENENPYDLANTILKMARKRAGVDAILTATGTSGLFTQDADSPAVQRDAGAKASTAASGDPMDLEDRERSTAQAPRGNTGQGRQQLPKLPKPGEVEDSVSVGQVRLTGTIVVTDKQRTDGTMRQSPQGPILGFQFDHPNGEGKIATVVLRGAMAEAFSAIGGGNASSLNGAGAVIAGEMFGDPWRKDGDPMPLMRRIEASSIETTDWKLPADMPADPPPAEAAPAAKRQAKAKPAAEPQQATVADAVHEQNQKAATAPAEAGPGLTASDFDAALLAGHVAGTYALSIAKERYGVETLFGLTDPQRLELAGELDLLSDEEN